MARTGLWYVLLLLKFCEFGYAKLASQSCTLENHSIGKCVPISFCPQPKNVSQSDSDALTRTCEAGTVCCRVSAKIVTPTGASPSAPAAPIGASGPAPQGAAPQGAAPASVPPQGTTATTAKPPTIGAAPALPASGVSVPPGGSAPPAGSSPPAGGPSGGAPPSGGPPPNGATPPAGAGGPPPIMASIVADPEMAPPKYYNPSGGIPSETIVSAEVMDNSIDTVDRKCELYHSMVQSPNPIPTVSRSQTPVVMIYGGTNTADKEFPHMAALGYGDASYKQWLCAGSLITEKYVVTAGHCLTTAPLGEVRFVKLGNTNIYQDTPNTQQFNVIGRIAHPQYDSRAQYNDIALVQLDRPVRITEYVMPICLFSSTNYEDRNLIATGWGKTEAGTVSPDLKKVGLELFTQNECQTAYSVVPKSQLPLGIQEPTQLCAGSRTERKDTCQGDSGGPLQIRKNNKWYLIGITSIGIQCGNVNYPGVYTRVASFVQWIQQNVWNK